MKAQKSTADRSRDRNTEERPVPSQAEGDEETIDQDLDEQDQDQ